MSVLTAVLKQTGCLCDSVAGKTVLRGVQQDLCCAPLKLQRPD